MVLVSRINGETDDVCIAQTIEPNKQILSQPAT